MGKKLNANESFRLWMNGLGTENIKENLEKNVKRDEQGRILISKDDEWCEETREVKLYQKYKHFKGNNIITVGISKPMSFDEEKIRTLEASYQVLFKIDNSWFNTTLFKFKDIDGLYHRTDEVSKEELVLYKTLDVDKQVFARIESMFLSKVDRVKYPDCEQKYRLELIK